MHPLITVRFFAAESPELMAQAWRLRHRVFRESLRWDIATTDLLEFDRFDRTATHCVTLEGGEVVGYWRALRTSEPYLLEQHFPMLLEHYPAPKSPQVWEISRFAVAPQHPQRREIGAALAHAFVSFGHVVGAREMIGITEPGFERFLKSCGLEMHRAAGPVVVGEAEGRPVRAIVTICPINEHNRRAAHLVGAQAA